MGIAYPHNKSKAAYKIDKGPTQPCVLKYKQNIDGTCTLTILFTFRLLNSMPVDVMKEEMFGPFKSRLKLGLSHITINHSFFKSFFKYSHYYYFFNSNNKLYLAW